MYFFLWLVLAAIFYNSFLLVGFMRPSSSFLRAGLVRIGTDAEIWYVRARGTSLFGAPMQTLMSQLCLRFIQAADAGRFEKVSYRRAPLARPAHAS